MSTYTQFGYTYAAPTSQLLVGQGSGSGGTNSCCEGTRAVMTDPVSGQTVCSCQYDRLAIGSYSRLGSGLGATGGVYSPSYTSGEQNPYPSIGVDSSAFYSPFSSGYSVKDGGSGDVSMYGTGLGASPAGYYPYDATFAAYGYGPGYDLAARRKNATRESTATLKAWLNEHKKNPYPTKGEKIMLAIITKMTLTQVSTWFANARRRLKKENKMTWEPRNKTDDDDAKLSDDEEDEKENADKEEEAVKKDEKEGSSMVETKLEGEGQTELKSCEGGAAPKMMTTALSPAPPMLHELPFSVSKGDKVNVLNEECIGNLQSKPKIWSLADTAACKTPPPPGALAALGGNWLSGNTTFPLPPSIPPSHPQYARFPQLMAAPNSAQYVSTYSENVGTDTPPQTPPNANKSSSTPYTNSTISGVSFAQAIPPSCNQTLSSCSRTAVNPQGGSNSNDSALHERYAGTLSIRQAPTGVNANPVTMHPAPYSPVYKTSQQAMMTAETSLVNSHSSTQQLGQSRQPHPQPPPPQQIACSQVSQQQQNQDVSHPYVS